MSYQIRFLDDGFFGDKYPVVKGTSKKDIVQYLWKEEKEHIQKIMGVKLSIHQGKYTLLFVNDDNEWYDLDTGKLVSIKYLQHLKKDKYEQSDVYKLNAKQFYNLVMLMWRDLCNEYGSAYLEFYEKKNNTWVDMLDV